MLNQQNTQYPPVFVRESQLGDGLGFGQQVVPTAALADLHAVNGDGAHLSDYAVNLINTACCSGAATQAIPVNPQDIPHHCFADRTRSGRVDSVVSAGGLEEKIGVAKLLALHATSLKVAQHRAPLPLVRDLSFETEHYAEFIRPLRRRKCDRDNNPEDDRIFVCLYNYLYTRAHVTN